jgi:hypothetical protein
MNGDVDGFGVQGLFFCASSIVAMSAAAALAFCYFWRKGRLGLDEDAKYQMMQEEDGNERRR